MLIEWHLSLRASTGIFFRDTSGFSKRGMPYSLPNKRTVMEHMDESFTVRIREWVREAQEDCHVESPVADVDFEILPNVVQCPYDNGFRQYIRVWDELFISNTVRMHTRSSEIASSPK